MKSGGRLGLIAAFRFSGRQTLVLRSNDCPPPLQVQPHVYASGGARVVGVSPKISLQPVPTETRHSNPRPYLMMSPRRFFWIGSLISAPLGEDAWGGPRGTGTSRSGHDVLGRMPLLFG